MNKVQEIPFQSLSQNRFIPWIVALMCYLAILALGIATCLNNTISHFHQSLEKAVTVELSPNYQGFTAPKDRKTEQTREQQLLHILKQYPKAGQVEVLSTSLLESFVIPWKASKQDPLFKKPLLTAQKGSGFFPPPFAVPIDSTI